MLALRTSRGTPPWITATASDFPMRCRIFSVRYSRVSRGSVKIKSLRRCPVCLVDHGRPIENLTELTPLRVLARLSEAISKSFEVAQDDEFGFQFRNRLSRRRAVRYLLFGVFKLNASGFVEVTVLFIVQD